MGVTSIAATRGSLKSAAAILLMSLPLCVWGCGLLLTGVLCVSNGDTKCLQEFLFLLQTQEEVLSRYAWPEPLGIVVMPIRESKREGFTQDLRGFVVGHCPSPRVMFSPLGSNRGGPAQRLALELEVKQSKNSIILLSARTPAAQDENARC
jgi:hypothetical protein